jgi:arabinofuranosyltransferase
MSVTSTPTALDDAEPEGSADPATTPEVAGRPVWHWWTTLGTGLVVVLVFAILAYRNRWISDDGLIVVREVRQILAGNGPNYNPFQRNEVDTSALWTWLLTGVAVLLRHDIATDAVVFGLECTIAGMLFGFAGSVRFQRGRGTEGLLVPAGLLIPVGVVAFWDFASSGLETGLSMLWLGATWWLLTGVTERSGWRRLVVVAAFVGLGPLVRPDFGLVTVVFGVAVLMINRPRLVRGIGYAVAGAVLPVGYEIFRAGYYGLTVPAPALAKEASSGFWTRGVSYFNDFLSAYQLWVPLVVACVVVVRMLSRTPVDRRTALLLGAPVLSGALLGIYVVWVGGDYMSGRMWVPVVFALLLPIMVIPVGRPYRTETVGVALLLVWTVLAGTFARTPYQGEEFGANGVTNERSYEAIAYGEPNPTTSDSRLRGNNLRPVLAQIEGNGNRLLVMSSGIAANGALWTIKLSEAVPDRTGFFYDNMGITDEVVPLDGTVLDVNGLATPLAGHLQLGQRGRAGHEKWLPAAWVIAEYADPAAIATMKDTPDVTKAQVRAAQHALSCGSLKELMDSVNQPMTAGRFWSNLTGVVSRTSLRIPADPFAAEKKFCG